MASELFVPHLECQNGKWPNSVLEASYVIHPCLLQVFVFDADGQQARKRNQSCRYVFQHSVLDTGVCSCAS